MSDAGIKQAIIDQARAEGFDAVGVAPARVGSREQARLDAFVAGGEHGEMGWMAETLARRRDPKTLWPAAESVIVLGLNYGPESDPMAELDRTDRANISAYARNRDYHDLIKKRLKRVARWVVETYGCEVKVFVDTAPVLEKPLAAQTRVGWQGKHSNLVSRDHGSWLFLGAIYTERALTPDAPERDHCGSCTACQAACPTDAFPAPYVVDARRCISYLTIEHKGPIPQDLREGIGNRVYGCDDCLAVCPWNKFADHAAANKAFLGRAELAAPDIGDLLDLDDATFREIFSGSPIKRIGRNRMVRNAAIAAGNSADPRLLARLRPLCDDEDPVIAEAAAWAIAKLTA